MDKFAAALLLGLAALVAACGSSGPPPQQQNKGTTVPAANSGTRTKGPAYTNEYRAAADKALSAWKAFIGNKTADNYAAAGAGFYEALRYRAMHVKNGHSSEGMHRYTELNLEYKNWKSMIGPKGWDENPKFLAAKAEYDKVQQGE